MTEPQGPQPPAGYTIRLAARLDARWAAWFDGFTVTGESDATTTLAGTVIDQAQLYGLLVRIRDLGIVLLSVEADACQIDSPGQARSGQDTTAFLSTSDEPGRRSQLAPRVGASAPCRLRGNESVLQ